MAQIIDSLVTEYRMKNQQYLQGAAQVNAATRSNASSISMAQKALGSGGGGLTGALGASSGAMAALGATASAVGVVLGTVASGAVAILAAGLKGFQDYAPFDSMIKSLESVEGGAKAAALAMKDLREISKAPGIGFQESVSAYVGARNAGLSPDFAKTIIKEVANANARGGGSIETFDRAMVAVKQIAAKQYLQGEELLQLMEAGIPVQGMLQGRFGTSDTEQLKKQGVTSKMVLAALTEEMAKLPRVAGGAQNSLDNFRSSIEMASISLGSAVAASIMPALDSATKEFERFESAGVFKAIGDQIAQFLDVNLDTKEVFTNATAAVMTFLDAMNVVKDTAIGVFNEIINFVNNTGIGAALKALFGVNFATIQAATGFSVGDRFAQNKSTIEQMLALDEKKSKKTASAQIEDKVKADIEAQKKVNAAQSPSKDPQEIVAKNTTKLVDLQQKQLDFQTALIGGGQVGAQAFSGLQVNAAAGGGSPTARTLLKAIDDHISSITGQRSVAVGRSYNYNR